MPRCRQSPVQKLAGCRFLLVGWLVLLSPITAHATPGPTEVIQRFCGQLLDALQHTTAIGARGRYQKLEPIVIRAFDLPFIAPLSVGPSWAKLQRHQKRC